MSCFPLPPTFGRYTPADKYKEVGAGSGFDNCENRIKAITGDLANTRVTPGAGKREVLIRPIMGRLPKRCQGDDKGVPRNRKKRKTSFNDSASDDDFSVNDDDDDDDDDDFIIEDERPRRYVPTRKGDEERGRSRGKDARRPPPKGRVPRLKKDIEKPVRLLADLISLAQNIETRPDYEYSIDVGCLKRLLTPLLKLQAMVGLASIKQGIVDHLLYLLSGLNQSNNMMHTVIYGAPGTGKTTLALILAEIYQALGFSNGRFKIVKRSDLVAGFLGQTTLKTQKAIDEAKGGVLFIDEAYSLGHPDGRDSYAKEVVDCLTQNLSEQRAHFICIIAGYRAELESNFFACNPGLRRRFPFQYEIDLYSAEELRLIFMNRVAADGWQLDPGFNPSGKIFQMYRDFFNDQGGDIETLVQMCKIAHSTRIFGKHQVLKAHINGDDFAQGLKAFMAMKLMQHRPPEDSQTTSGRGAGGDGGDGGDGENVAH